MYLRILLTLSILLLLHLPVWAGTPTLDLDVALTPGKGRLEVTAKVTHTERAYSFDLSARAKISHVPGGLQAGPVSADGRTRRYSYVGAHDLVLRYGMELPKFAPGRGMPTAVLDRQGVYLDAGSAWYPLIANTLHRYRLRVALPQGWKLVCAGQGPRANECEMDQPQRSVYLVAAPYRHYRSQDSATPIHVYLREPDEMLAQRYIEASRKYLALYQDLIGPYPYSSFSIVENRWQTGYGMPGFTLLGSRVLRLPFLLHTSLPHEILHNWWGNGVYVDYAQGNWSEGLTAYLADYLLAERTGQGAMYRLRQLTSFQDYAAGERDAPPSAFRGRHGDSSQAVGYAKVLMLFHMVRQRLGDQPFFAGLRCFYRDYRHRRASVSQLAASLARCSKDPDIEATISSWWIRSGAPHLRIDTAKVAPTHSGFLLTLKLRQVQPGPAFPLRVPVVITSSGEPPPRQLHLDMSKKVARLQVELPRRPARIDVDPDFDLMRALGRDERPRTFSELFGARRQWLLLPANASAEERRAWRTLAEVWKRRFGNVQTALDTDAELPPANEPIWILGWSNRYRARVVQRATTPSNSLVLRGPDLRGRSTGFVGVTDPSRIPRLASRLTHYGSYGELRFHESDGRVLSKRRLRGAGGSLTRTFPDTPVTPDIGAQ